jgi:hypothetical protein
MKRYARCGISLLVTITHTHKALVEDGYEEVWKVDSSPEEHGLWRPMTHCLWLPIMRHSFSERFKRLVQKKAGQWEDSATASQKLWLHA